MRRIYFYMSLCLAIGLVTSCTDRENNNDDPLDGAWDAMEWKTENINGVVNVNYASDALVEFNISGKGSVELVCQNYYPWISYGTYYPEVPDNIWEYNYEWLHISINKNVMVCEFENVPEDFHKEILVDMTAGDIFCTFLFTREEDLGVSGKWAPITWVAENLQGDVEFETFTYRTNIIVEGKCRFDLVCPNYENIWFTPGLFTPEPLDIHKVDFDWIHLTIKDNVLHFELDPWDGTMEEFKDNPDWDGETPFMDIDVSAGEISHQLNIYQKSLLNR